MKSKPRVRWMIAAAVLGISTTAAMAEDAAVKFNQAKVFTEKSVASDTVISLTKGEKVQVLAREGAWAKISAGGKQGWISANAVGDPKGKSGFAGLGEVAGKVSGSESASGSAAGKGGLPSEQWAQSKNLSRAGLQRMMALRDTVGGSEIKTFDIDGNVGIGKK
jgi:outer membrane lipoprotein SlyB